MDGEQATEVLQRQLLVVDMDGDFAVGAAVVDDAAEHVAARNPLIAAFMVVDLRLSGRFLDNRIVPFLQEARLCVEDAIIHRNNVGVGHRCDARPDGDVRRGQSPVGMVNSRGVAIAGNTNLTEQYVSRSLRAHVRAPGAEYIRMPLDVTCPWKGPPASHRIEKERETENDRAGPEDRRFAVVATGDQGRDHRGGLNHPA
jgi:hypothetical protein